MSERVDELFGSEPNPGGQPNTLRIVLLLVLGVPLDLLGLISCASIPGALLTWGAWRLASRDLEGVANGQIAVRHAPRLTKLKTFCSWALVWCSLTFVLQLVMLYTRSYASLLAWLPL